MVHLLVLGNSTYSIGGVMDINELQKKIWEILEENNANLIGDDTFVLLLMDGKIVPMTTLKEQLFDSEVIIENLNEIGFEDE